MRTLVNVAGFLILIGGAASLGFLLGWCGRVKVENSVPPPLPTIQEIQERVGAEPDGKLGPKTQRLWDKEICNQFARPYFNAEHPE